MIFPFLTGFLFAIGLGISGMTRPPKILAFLNVAGNWDPSLLIVIGTAVCTYFILYRTWVDRSIREPLEEYLKTKEKLDVKVIIGAIFFGTGWGILGLCPGPALVNLATLNPQIITFIIAMVFGIFFARLQSVYR